MNRSTATSLSDVKRESTNSLSYIRKHGITKNVLNECNEEDVVRGGFAWVLDKFAPLMKKHGLHTERDVLETDEKIDDDWITLLGIGTFFEEIQNGGFGQFVINHQDTYDITVAALIEVGAVQTASAIEKAIQYYNSQQCSSSSNLVAKAQDIYADEKYEAFIGDCDEDYIALMVRYFKNKKQGSK
jgi:hypothetical protein